MKGMPSATTNGAQIEEHHHARGAGELQAEEDAGELGGEQARRRAGRCAGCRRARTAGCRAMRPSRARARRRRASAARPASDGGTPASAALAATWFRPHSTQQNTSETTASVSRRSRRSVIVAVSARAGGQQQQATAISPATRPLACASGAVAMSQPGGCASGPAHGASSSTLSARPDSIATPRQAAPANALAHELHGGDRHARVQHARQPAVVRECRLQQQAELRQRPGREPGQRGAARQRARPSRARRRARRRRGWRPGAGRCSAPTPRSRRATAG